MAETCCCALRIVNSIPPNTQLCLTIYAYILQFDLLVGSLAEEIQGAGRRLPVGARDEVRASFCDLMVHGDQWSR